MKCSLKTFDRSMGFRCPSSQLQGRSESSQLIRLTEELHRALTLYKAYTMLTLKIKAFQMEQISDCEDIIETLNSRASCSNRLQVIPLNELISFEKMKFSKGRVCLKTRKFESKNKKQTIFELEIPTCPAMLTMHRQ